jgi:hypothetical protein
MGASSDRFSIVLPTRVAAAAVAFVLVMSGACGDEEKDEPQRSGESEKLETPTSVQDTRTTLGGG